MKKAPFDKTKVRVGVLQGGLSAERKVSSVSGQGVLGALLEKGWNAVEIFVDRRADVAIREAEIDIAFLALHGKFGEDGCVQGMLEMMGIPYTGSGVQASAIAMDKLATKQLLRDNGITIIPASESRAYSKADGDVLFKGKPVVVKPRSGGSTIGISLARNQEEMNRALAEAWKYNPVAIVEAFIPGDEITIPVLNGKALPVVHILPKGTDDNQLFDFTRKYEKGAATFECPAKLNELAMGRAQHMAEVVYKILGCRGLARADFIVSDFIPSNNNSIPYFLEINTIPGLTPTSLSPMSAGAVGMSYPDLCEAILQSATCEDEEFPPAE